MKKFAVLAALAALVMGPANAAPVGFTGDYAFSTWTAGYTGAGSPVGNTATIDASGQTLTLIEPDNASLDSACYESQAGCAFTFSHTIAAAGTLSFNWAFDWGIDPCCSGFNVYVNGTYYTLANGHYGDIYAAGQGSTSGLFSVAVNAGDVLTLEQFSADACCQAATTTITNFDAPTADVPEPAMLGLFGMGALGLGLARRRRA